MKSFKVSAFVMPLLVVAVAVIGSTGVAHAAKKTTAQVENLLQYGVQDAVNWDGDCKDHLQGYRNSYFTSNGGGSLRTGGINGGASYHNATWMSKRGQGNASVPLSVNYGTTSIALQVNDLVFLCGPLVTPDIAANGSACKTNVSGASIINSSSRWVTSVNNANDRAPNDFGSGCMYPAMAFSRRKIVDFKVVSSPWGGTATLDAGNGILNLWRDDNSRYWTATTNFTYKTAAGKPITSSGTIHLVMDNKYFAAYHTTNEYRATKSCSGGGPRNVTNAYLDIDDCATSQTDLYINIVLNFDYTLTPQITTSPSLLREGDNNINVSASVNNTGNTASDDVDWSVTRFVVAPGGNYTKGGVAAAPCTQFSGFVGGSCQTVRNGTTKFPKGTTNVANFVDTLASVPDPGSKVCYVTSVNKGSVAAPTWKHSTVSCSTIERVPFVQVLGNDLRVGAVFNGTNVAAGATSLVFNNTGSWVEYGILAPGSVANIASQSGANGGNASPQSAWSGLTFANTGTPVGCAPAYGCFDGASNLGKIPSVSGFVKTATYNGAPLNHDQGAASFNASDIGGIIPGANIDNFMGSAAITTTGTITIDKDITYNTGSLTNANGIPQLILIGNNINIAGNVKHVDAWLIATGTINTCSDVAQTAVRSTNCSNQLLINGPVMANQLLLDRSYYDKTKPEDAAEKINLRSDSYIWSSNVAHQNGQWQTVYSTDLPPRY